MCVYCIMHYAVVRCYKYYDYMLQRYGKFRS